MTPVQQTFWLCFVVYPLVVGIQSSLLIGLVWLSRHQLVRRFQSLRLVLWYRRWHCYSDSGHLQVTTAGSVDFHTALIPEASMS